jgi:hypothetical protein
MTTAAIMENETYMNLLHKCEEITRLNIIISKRNEELLKVIEKNCREKEQLLRIADRLMQITIQLHEFHHNNMSLLCCQCNLSASEDDSFNRLEHELDCRCCGETIKFISQ